MARRLLPAAMATVVVLSACSQAENDNSADSTDPRNQPGYIVDSIHPPGVALDRFREGLEQPTTLDGPRTRDELVSRFMRAVTARHADSLHALTITRAEFAYLVYPESQLSKPPYRQPPEVTWMLLQAETGSGAQKLLNRAAGGLETLGYRCPDPPEPEGAMNITTGCVVTVRESGARREMKLFGRIVERDGRWKFIALGGDL